MTKEFLEQLIELMGAIADKAIAEQDGDSSDYHRHAVNVMKMKLERML